MDLEELVATLEEDIVLGVIQPRQRLIEDEVMARFTAKRHVVRQSFTELERIGLVERRRNIGAVVRSYTAEEVTNLFAVRELLEGYCADTLPLPVSEDHITELEAIQTKHDNAIAEGDLRGIFRANMAFHRTLFGLSDNPVLVTAIHDHAQRAHAIRSSNLRSREHMERARLEHWAMIETLKNGDRKRMVELCKAHIQPSRDAYIEATSDRIISCPKLYDTEA
ncbi:GntR family transcriptional regulator [Brucella sp. BE17]|uniref:GntR family transcriptional regulator n=1 Tax=Brucella sp. BE17 TaxID=3142977 RepID=UPI0031BBB45D